MTRVAGTHFRGDNASEPLLESSQDTKTTPSPEGRKFVAEELHLDRFLLALRSYSPGRNRESSTA